MRHSWRPTHRPRPAARWPRRPLLAERTGFAPHYRPGLLEAVARNRSIPASACMIAAYDFAINSWVFMRSHRNGRNAKCRAVDTCAPQDCRRLRARGDVAELGWPAAVCLCEHESYADRDPTTCRVTVWN